jgi:hypothetical protein
MVHSMTDKPPATIKTAWITVRRSEAVIAARPTMVRSDSILVKKPIVAPFLCAQYTPRANGVGRHAFNSGEHRILTEQSTYSRKKLADL